MATTKISQFLIEYPKQCPMCHYLVPINSHQVGVHNPIYNMIFLVTRCTNDDCMCTLFCIYEPIQENETAKLKQVFPILPTREEIPEVIHSAASSRNQKSRWPVIVA